MTLGSWSNLPVREDAPKRVERVMRGSWRSLNTEYAVDLGAAAQIVAGGADDVDPGAGRLQTGADVAGRGSQ
jgi:hypothetical protein